MGSQLPAGGQGGLTPEALAAIQAMGGMQAMPYAPAGPSDIQPMPNPVPGVGMPPMPLPNAPATQLPQGAAGQSGILAGILKNLFGGLMGGTDAKSLSAGVPQAPPPSTYELQQQRNQFSQLAPK